MIAVIGHLNSYVTLPASSIYQFGGLVMLTPGSTNPQITRQGYSRIFRTTLSDDVVGAQMAAYAARQGYKRIMVSYARNRYGKALANAFERQARMVDLTVVDRRSYGGGADHQQASLKRIAMSWQDREFSAIFLAGTLPEAGHLIAQIRRSGITQPILTGDGVDSPTLVDVAGEAAEGVVVASMFHPAQADANVKAFRRAFENRYGSTPDSWAARGYDTVHLLAEAIRHAGTTVPDSIASSLRRMQAYSGVVGSYAFNDRGELQNISLVRKVVRGGRLFPLAPIAESSPSRRPVADVSQ